MMVLVVKDHEDKLVGRVEYPMGSRKFKIVAGDDSFAIDFPLRWNRTAELRGGNKDSVLSLRRQRGWLPQHEFEIPDYGTLVSDSAFWSRYDMCNYQLNGESVGSVQKISASRDVGKLALLPASLPLHIRIFILAL